jgi:hypothetical protein
MAAIRDRSYREITHSSLPSIVWRRMTIMIINSPKEEVNYHEGATPLFLAGKN